MNRKTQFAALFFSVALVGLSVLGVRLLQTTVTEGSAIAFMSSAFNADQMIPGMYSKNGGNYSPPLEFNSIPKEAKSLVIVVHTPDDKSGDFAHWLLWNIPPTDKNIPGNAVPKHVVQGTNDFGNKKWDGPDPAQGVQRYQFSLYVLNDKLSLPDTTKRPELMSAIRSHIIDSASFTSYYRN